jgi:alkylation response protein AidB-like acyl-CoA dehydrogenase
LLRHATDHVSERTAGTERLIQLQMVKGMIAEALTEQLEAEALLDGRTDPVVLIEANARIQAADRILLRLLGASGFQAGLPSHTCWVSELLADAYIGYETPDGAS